ncbi:RING finger and SPRY domain-containing protein 1-like [Trichoplusia ni]|uniref:RING finger and SPRY domain-containing protein 1-like n=1 Tax=Trichoplusia ni TaxID=7111 RepID=A0A7E5VI03_TRINI|nr:RING finger and SPRY domain-containing protein 1-like [Trichoplusia ni]XP_026727831.1 RING finger and SPRY domain-containing protein 1-like [Trichoplusia ni]
MGACCCKNAARTESYAPPAGPIIDPTEPRIIVPKSIVETVIIDKLVLELLALIASFVDNDEESPVSLVKLHAIADKEEGWFQVVSSMVTVIPLENPLGPSAITIVFDDCPLPSKDSVIKLTQLFGLSAMRALMGEINVKIERNICVVLCCIADKLAGPNSVAVLTEETLDYMLSFLMFRREPRIVLFALIALEKFAHSTENKVTIKKRLDTQEEHPLLALEQYADSTDYIWRQVGFAAKWALDNIFIVKDRLLAFETVDMSNINAILNTQDASEYLKISGDGLEARCDSYSFESVRCTFEVSVGCWYYECTIITAGVMQIGWATRGSHFMNHEGYGIGDDLYSLSYDGCRKLIWHEAKPSPLHNVTQWQSGDVVGCLIDMDMGEAVFYLNGEHVRTCTELFETTRQGFFAAASFMAFQQCRFNFGSEPFQYPPDRAFNNFNDCGFLSEDEKKVVPRRFYLEKLRNSSIKENCCTVCFDNESCCVLEPCMHSGFCSLCTAQLKECPLCRALIMNIRVVPA